MAAAVVNHLHFKGPIDRDVFATADTDLIRRMAAIEGFRAIHVVQVADDHAVLVIVADSPDVLNRVATEIGSPWMTAHVVPLLARPPERYLGNVIVSGEA